MSRDAHLAPPARCLAIWCLTTLATVALGGLLAPRLSATASLPARGPLPFEVLLLHGSAVALAACAAWAWAATTAAVLEALTGRTAIGRPCPARWRAAVLAACGVALVLGPSPASADQSVGLPPTTDAEAAAARSTEPAVEPRTTPGATAAVPHLAALPTRAPITVTVEPGDSLWAIAERALPAEASDAEVDRRWRAIWRANREVIGVDPHHIEPRMVLRVDEES